MNQTKTKILLFTGFYLPGFKGGGPIRTIANIIDKLGDYIQFHLVTADRDLGDAKCFPTIDADRWQQVDKIKIYYASPNKGWLWRLWKLVQEFEGDALHLNSFFSYRFSILPLLFWRVHKRSTPVILGPRGEFSQGALALKSAKKHFYIKLTNILGFYRDVIWHASTEHEAEDIRRMMGDRAQIRIAVDIACPPPLLTLHPRSNNDPLRMLFLSRISPKKNLLGAIQMLHKVQCPVVFDVYGPVEDPVYWASCQEAAKQLPSYVRFNHCGSLFPAQVSETMARYDLFYLTTLGENFGHVIAEALGCGLPVLIADTTPWRNLAQKKLGWDIPLTCPDQFVAAIEDCASMSANEYYSWRQDIRAWALANIGNDVAVDQNRRIFMNLDTKHEH